MRRGSRRKAQHPVFSTRATKRGERGTLRNHDVWCGIDLAVLIKFASDDYTACTGAGTADRLVHASLILVRSLFDDPARFDQDRLRRAPFRARP